MCSPKTACFCMVGLMFVLSSETALNSCHRPQLSWCLHMSGIWLKNVGVFFLMVQTGQACKEHVSPYEFSFFVYLSSRHPVYVQSKLIFWLILLYFSHFTFPLMSFIYQYTHTPLVTSPRLTFSWYKSIWFLISKLQRMYVLIQCFLANVCMVKIHIIVPKMQYNVFNRTVQEMFCYISNTLYVTSYKAAVC
jgi:hypothetical protein